MILCANPQAQYAAYKTEIDAAVSRVFKEGRYILGDEVKAFEEEFARYVGVKHSIGVGSGTEALHLALVAWGIGAGDEVITVSHTAVATAAAIALTGATPVFVDVDPETLTMDPNQLKAAISPKTKAVIVVHLYGHPADLKPIIKIAREHQLKILEDCAQAHGALYDGQRIGSFGDAAAFSFYPTKNLGAIGDGGALVTNDSALAEACRALREYGWSKDRVSQTRGWNSRLDELQAAILRIKLRHLDRDNDCRRSIAQYYGRELAGTQLALPIEKANVKHVYHLYVVRSPRRDALREMLMKNGVQAMIHYTYPVHLQTAYQTQVRIPQPLAQTELAVRNILSLPMYPQLSSAERKTVVDVIKEFLKSE